jgi:hypothetical protein
MLAYLRKGKTFAKPATRFGDGHSDRIVLRQ